MENKELNLETFADAIDKFLTDNEYSIGAENLKKPEIRARVDAELERIRNEKVADAQEVIEYLTSVMRGECTEEIICMSKDGTQKVVSVEVCARDRIKSAELIGKRHGMWSEKLNVNTSLPIILEGEDKLEE